MTQRKWAIRFQWRDKDGQRVKAFWPILFDNLEDAEAHVIEVDVFQNLRKFTGLSCCIELKRIQR